MELRIFNGNLCKTPYFCVKFSLEKPNLGIQFGATSAQLELEDVVGTYGTDGLARANLLTLENTCRAKVAIDGIIGSVPDNDNPQTGVLINGTNFTVINTAG